MGGEWFGSSRYYVRPQLSEITQTDIFIFLFNLRERKCPVDGNYDFYKSSMGVFRGSLLWRIMQSFNAVSGGIIKNQTKEENNHNQCSVQAQAQD